MSDTFKVLLPTDFSVQSDYAYIMVQNLAKKIPLEVTLLHVLNVPDTVSMDAEGNIKTCGEIDQDYVNTQKEIALSKLQSLKDLHGNAIKTKFKLGKLTSSIIDYSEAEGFDLIAMGTKGTGGLFEKITKSEAQILARKSANPVLTLMCDRSDFNLETIALVQDFRSCNNQELGFLNVLIKSFNTRVHLLQITSDPSAENREEIEQNMETFAANNKLAKYDKHILKDKDVENGVIHFNQMNNVDMVFIGTHGTGGWFHESAAEQLVNHMYKPVVTYRMK